jgi:hypothetical protein
VNTSLGINFLRTVNEEGSNGWAQVYARIPFDDYELRDKGALFGVFLGKQAENWADVEAELMEWVDEYFNKAEKGGEMMEFAKVLREKYPEIDGAWMWVTPKEDGRRELKIIRWGEAGVILVRNNGEFELTKEEGKVISGAAMEKDTIKMWSGTLGKMLVEDQEKKETNEDTAMNYGNKLVEAREAGAGLFFVFDKYQTEGIEFSEKVDEEISEVMATDIDEENVSEQATEDLAGETIVGKMGTKEKLVNWWRKIKPVKRQELRVERVETTKRKRWAVFLGVLFLILLSVSLVTGSIKIKADREAKKWNDFSEPITKSIQEAQDLVKINPSGAKKLMEDVKNTFNVQKAEFVNGKYKTELAKLEEQVNVAWTTTSGEKQSQINELVNIQLIRAGFVGDRMSLIKDSNLLVLDSKMGVVVTVVTASKDIKVVAGKGDTAGWVDTVSDGSKVLVLDSKGVSLNGTDLNGIVFDMAVNKPIALGLFGANVYVLDSGNKEIYKYGAISDGYGERTMWLKQGQSIDVNPVDMAIDASVWILGDNGVVEKFTRGTREQFTLNGVPDGAKTTKIALQQTGTSLALLDTTNGMVIVCNKTTGNCDQQLKSDKLKTASDIEYDGSGNLLVLINGTVGVLN